MLAAGPRGRDRGVAARRGARLPVGDGQRRALPAVHRGGARGGRGAARRAHRGRPRDRVAASAASSCAQVVSRSAPPLLALMDLEAVRDAAFCHRHREITREQGKELARERLERARRDGAEWVVLFEDVTPLGSHRLEMHVASGRALHAAAELPLDAGRPTFTLEVVQLDPRRRRVAARQAAGDADPDVRHPRGMGGAHRAGAQPVRKGLTVATHPKRIIDAHCHIGEIPPWKYYDLEHPVKPTSTTTRRRRTSSRATWTTSRSSARSRSPTTACRSTSCRSTSTTS